MPRRDWKALHLESLRENRPDRYETLRASGELAEYLRLKHEEADDLFRNLEHSYLRADPPNKDWEQNWAIRERAARDAEHEVMREVVLVMDEETEEAMRGGRGYVDGPQPTEYEDEEGE